MKILIVCSHPDTNGFHHTIKNLMIERLSALGHTVQVRNPYTLDFVWTIQLEELQEIDKGRTPQYIRAEQDYFRWAELVILIQPLWWGSFPAIAKAYLEKVFCYGFAYIYAYEQRRYEYPLSGKKLILISTGENPDGKLSNRKIMPSFQVDNLKEQFSFFGFEVMQNYYFDEIPANNTSNRRLILEEIKKLTSKIK